VVVLDWALAAISGSAVLHAHSSTLMWTLIDDLGQGEGQLVSGHTLDDAAQSVPPPHLIKVDVEGAELEVLRGGATFLARQKPTLIVEFSNPELLIGAQHLLPY